MLILLNLQIDEMNPEIPERDGADASAGHDTFVAHQWDRKETPAKRIRTPRATNVTKLGNVYAVYEDDEEAAGSRSHRQRQRGSRAGIIQASPDGASQCRRKSGR